ncbi:Asp23/Gls24 family envelope stress response protein [Guggenheimella bovis]
MSIEIKNKYGSINIEPQIITETAAIAASEVYGVVGLQAPNLVKNILKPDASKGVSVEIEEDGVKITLDVILLYGVKINTVAQNLVDNVRYQTEKQLGIRVKDVIVNIVDIKVDR